LFAVDCSCIAGTREGLLIKLKAIVASKGDLLESLCCKEGSSLDFVAQVEHSALPLDVGVIPLLVKRAIETRSETSSVGSDDSCLRDTQLTQNVFRPPTVNSPQIVGQKS